MSKVAAIGEVMIELSPMITDADNLGSNTAQKKMAMNLAFGGDTFNTGIYLARFGINVDYITRLGTDDYSKQILALLSAEKIGTSLITQVNNACPGLYSITNSADGERQFNYWRNESPAKKLFDNTNQASELFEKLKDFDYIYLSGISLAIISKAARVALFKFLDSYRQQGGKVVFDSNYRARLWKNHEEARDVLADMYKKTDIALLTFEDEQELWDYELPQQCLDYCQQANVGEVVLKQGKDNVIVYTNQQMLTVEVPAVDNVVDTTGAGDSFNAGYLAARIKGLNMMDAAKSGIDRAANVIQHRGAIIPLSDLQASA